MKIPWKLNWSEVSAVCINTSSAVRLIENWFEKLHYLGKLKKVVWNYQMTFPNVHDLGFVEAPHRSIQYLHVMTHLRAGLRFQTKLVTFKLQINFLPLPYKASNCFFSDRSKWLMIRTVPHFSNKRFYWFIAPNWFVGPRFLNWHQQETLLSVCIVRQLFVCKNDSWV